MNTTHNAAAAAPSAVRWTSDEYVAQRFEIGRSQEPTERYALSVIGILLLLRLVLLPMPLLIPEEAYYWMYSQYPAFGYLDHPPMVAWLIAAGKLLFGDSELGVRFFTWLLAVGSTLLCFRLAMDWCGRRAGVLAAAMFAIAPLYFGSGFLATPDAPLIFFWLGALVAVTRAYRTDALGWWFLAGAATGLAFVSKYPGAFLVLGTFLFLITDARGRRLLARPGPWLALTIALAVTTPVLYWNANNDWASFKFQFARRVGGYSDIRPLNTFQWVGAQFALMSPLVFYLLTMSSWVAARRLRRAHNSRWRFAACFALPWLTVCMWHGLFAQIKINWPLPAYLSLLPIAALLLRTRGLPLLGRMSWAERRVMLRRYGGAMVAINAAVLLYVSIDIPFLPRPAQFAHWNKLGWACEKFEDDLEAHCGTHPFIVADGNYHFASELAFYMRDPEVDDWQDVIPVRAAFGRGLSYTYWRHPQQFLGRNAICVLKEPKSSKLETLGASFNRIDPPRPLFSDTRRLGQKHQYWVVYCYGFHGVPTSTADGTCAATLSAAAGEGVGRRPDGQATAARTNRRPPLLAQ